jgi:hypothetical protein
VDNRNDIHLRHHPTNSSTARVLLFHTATPSRSPRSSLHT